jgi:two-component system, chemotaxis family, response regulator Rcp1
MDELTTKVILLVEDNPADVYLIQRAVQDCGNDIRLSVVPDGNEALAFLRKDAPFAHVPSPALTIVDLNLPKMPGAQVLTEMRRLPAYQATPIVVFSGAAKDVEEPHCLQLGASAYVQKSANFHAYFASVKAIVHQWLRPDSARYRTL